MHKYLKLVFVLMLSAVLSLCACSINSVSTAGDNSNVLTGDQEPLPPPEELEPLTVYCFKAGKADAHLIYNSKAAVLIDCGEKGFGKEIVSYMKARGISKLDLLIVTHFDKDHVGGAAKVISEVPVAQVVQSNCPKESDEYSNYLDALSQKGITPVTPGIRQSVRLGGAEITVYPPMKRSYPDSPSNNSSLITSVRYGRNSMLFAGDAENMRLAEFTGGNDEHYDLLKVPYHGHYQTRLQDFLQSVSPRIAVITSSDKEPEDQRVMELLSDEGALVYLTRTAPVVITCDGKTLTADYDQ